MKRFAGYFAAFLACVALSSQGAWAYDEYVGPEPDPEAPVDGGGGETASGNPSVREAAVKARNRAVTVAAVTAAAAVGLGYKCATVPWPGNSGYCILTALTAMGSFQAFQYANNKDLMANIQVPNHEQGNVPTPEGDPYCVDLQSCQEDGGGDGGSEPTLQQVENDLKDVKKNLAKGGFGFDDKGNIKTPNGTVAASSLTPATLAGLGASHDMQAELRNKIQAEIAAAEAGKEKDSMSAGSGGAIGLQAVAGRNHQQWQQAQARGPASVDGLSVRRGDDLIGVKSADIFEMVHRKYQEERKRTDFLE